MNYNFSVKSLFDQNKVFSFFKDQVWVVLDWMDEDKTSLIFKSSNVLLLTKKGKVQKLTWEIVGKDLIIINRDEESFLFKIEYHEKNIIVLKNDERSSLVYLINEPTFNAGINSKIKILNYFGIKDNEISKTPGGSENTVLETLFKIKKNKEEEKANGIEQTNRLFFQTIFVLIVIVVLISIVVTLFD